MSTQALCNKDIIKLGMSTEATLSYVNNIYVYCHKKIKSCIIKIWASFSCKYFVLNTVVIPGCHVNALQDDSPQKLFRSDCITLERCF